MSAVTAESLVQLLERFGDSVLLLDCRSPGASHEAVSIRGAARVVLPSIVERRSKGTVPLGCLILKPDVRQALSTGSFRAVIVYDQSSRTVRWNGRWRERFSGSSWGHFRKRYQPSMFTSSWVGTGLLFVFDLVFKVKFLLHRYAWVSGKLVRGYDGKSYLLISCIWR